MSLKHVLQGKGTEGKGSVPRSQVGQRCQGYLAAPLIGGLGIGQEEIRSADILQWIPSQILYSNIPLISIGENLVFNNLSLGLNLLTENTVCVCGGGVVVFCCFAFAFWRSHEACGILVP